MSNVIAFPNSIDRLWEKYRRLAEAAVANPALFSNPRHCIELARAWEAWRVEFVKQDQAA